MPNSSYKIWPVFFAVLIAILCSKCSASLKCACGKPGSSSPRIVNGVKAGPNEFPWIVAIRLKHRIPLVPYCGGSLISDRYVLTAAHCLAVMRNKKQWTRSELLFGMHYARANPPDYQVRNIKKAILKVQYHNVSKDFDLGLLETDKPVDISYKVYPICLPYDIKFPSEDPLVMAAGWGKLHSRDKKTSPHLMKSKWMELASRDKCVRTTKFGKRHGLRGLSDRMICGVSDETDACVGDSGGPLMYYSTKFNRYFLVGITSYGYGCNQPDDPGVYTNLFHPDILDWITCANRGKMCSL